MKTDKKLGKLRSLIHVHDRFYTSSHSTEDMIKRLDSFIESYNDHYTKFVIERRKAFTEIKKLVLELNLTGDEYHKITVEEMNKKNFAFKIKMNPFKEIETRDNKGVYVGSGNSNANKIRYPKKNRSKRVWSIFYKMFPRMAEKDGWDGETSNRT